MVYTTQEFKFIFKYGNSNFTIGDNVRLTYINTGHNKKIVEGEILEINSSLNGVVIQNSKANEDLIINLYDVTEIKKII